MICSRFMLLFFYSGKVGFLSKRVLWKSNCFSGLQTTLGDFRELTGFYDPKAKLLIFLCKCVWKRRLWNGSWVFYSGFFFGGGAGGGM